MTTPPTNPAGTPRLDTATGQKPAPAAAPGDRPCDTSPGPLPGAVMLLAAGLGLLLAIVLAHPHHRPAHHHTATGPAPAAGRTVSSPATPRIVAVTLTAYTTPTNNPSDWATPPPYGTDPYGTTSYGTPAYGSDPYGADQYRTYPYDSPGYPSTPYPARTPLWTPTPSSWPNTPAPATYPNTYPAPLTPATGPLAVTPQPREARRTLVCPNAPTSLDNTGRPSSVGIHITVSTPTPNGHPLAGSPTLISCDPHPHQRNLDACPSTPACPSAYDSHDSAYHHRGWQHHRTGRAPESTISDDDWGAQSYPQTSTPDNGSPIQTNLGSGIGHLINSTIDTALDNDHHQLDNHNHHHHRSNDADSPGERGWPCPSRAR